MSQDLTPYFSVTNIDVRNKYSIYIYTNTALLLSSEHTSNLFTIGWFILDIAFFNNVPAIINEK